MSNETSSTKQASENFREIRSHSEYKPQNKRDRYYNMLRFRVISWKNQTSEKFAHIPNTNHKISETDITICFLTAAELTATLLRTDT